MTDRFNSREEQSLAISASITDLLARSNAIVDEYSRFARRGAISDAIAQLKMAVPLMEQALVATR